MTDLKKRMLEDMQLKDLSESTQKSYLHSVSQLARHYGKSPDLISDEELRRYFLYNRNNRKWSRAACSVSLCGIKFFYTHTLKREWTSLRFVRPGRDKKLPVILTSAEVRKILNKVKMPYHKSCLQTIYSLGLRIHEGTHLQVSDIDSSRMFVHIKQSKGKKDRYIPLAQRTLDLLRTIWQTHKNPVYIFPAPGRGSGTEMPKTKVPMPKASIQIAFRDALLKTGIRKKVSVHHLRHAYAVHLLEAGVDIRHIQEYLGHTNLNTTMIYTKLTKVSLKEPQPIIDRVMEDL
jgi:site-specific recombinase XerD